MGTIKGAYTTINGHNNVWHELHTKTAGYAGLQAYGSFEISRSSKADKSLKVKGSFGSRGVGTSPSYGYKVYWALIDGQELQTVNNKTDKSNKYVSKGTVKAEGTIGQGMNISCDFDETFDMENGTLYFCYKCGQTGGCTMGYLGSDSGDSRWIVVGSETVPEYNPYSFPGKYTVDPDRKMGVYGETTFKFNYQIDIGDTSVIDWVNGQIYKGDFSWSYGRYPFGTSNEDNNNRANFENNRLDDLNIAGRQAETTKSINYDWYYTFKGDKFSDGMRYRVAILFSDCTNQVISGDDKSVYLYRNPVARNLSLSSSNISGDSSLTLTWSCNKKRWKDDEADFTSQYIFENKTARDCSSNAPTGFSTNNDFEQVTQTITKSDLDKIFTVNERSQDSISTKVAVIRRNLSSSKDYTTSYMNLSIQYLPKYEVTNVLYYNTKDNSLVGIGSDQYTNNCPEVKVTWNYSTASDKGVISGYEIKIYDSNNNQVGDTYNTSNKYITLDTKKNLKRGELNQIEITPYYDAPNATRKRGKSIKQDFITPIGIIYKPVIEGPINNTTWHNKQFRIILKCPEDDDMDILGLSDSEYEYEDIEVKIEGQDKNNNAFKLIYTLKNHNIIFNTSKIHHKYNIVINPSIISSFPEALYYNISIRFQKKYYKNIWSDYSDIIHLMISGIKELNINKIDLIKIDHYKLVRGYSLQLFKVYNDINSLNKDNILRSKNDIIYAMDYQGIYNTILNIQSKINNYTKYDSDRQNVRFNQSINALSEANAIKQKQDIVTANKISNNPVGKNAFNILIECMNKLY